MSKKINTTFVENEKEEIEDVKEVNYPIIVECDVIEEQENVTVDVTIMERTGDVKYEND